MAESQIKINAIRWVLLGSVLLMAIKFMAWFITHSNAILSDALESIINVVAGAFALYSIYYASKPSDKEHPYGHGKMEFLSAGFEGGLIFLTGAMIIAKSVHAFFHPAPVFSLDLGALLAGVAGFGNFIMGRYLVRIGKKHNSLALIAEGKHLISDTISSAGLVIGVLVIYFTGMMWLDNLMASVFGIIIIVTGYRLLKQSVSGLLDEADQERISQLVEVLDKNRRDSWIDIHNLRILKYGHRLHVDTHLTLPWYRNLKDTHEEVAILEKLAGDAFGGDIEFFIHSDPCKPLSCPICSLQNCPERKAPFTKKITWTIENVQPDRRHHAGTHK